MTEVLPFYDALGVRVKTILSDNGCEFSGWPDHQPCHPLLVLHTIEHRTTEVHLPRTNAFVKRMNRTRLNEHSCIEGRETWYEAVLEIESDLSIFIEFYNRKRSHQGSRLTERTPAEAP